MVDEDVLGGDGYSQFFLACVSDLKREEIIRRSPKGQVVGLLLGSIEILEQQKLTEIAIFVVSKVYDYIITG